MKSPTGKLRPRRASPQKPVQLNLRRVAATEDDELAERPSNFWKWFAVILFLHVFAFIIVMLIFHGSSTPPPKEFISLLPPGDVAKGTPGAQAAPKVGPTTPAPAHHKSVTPPAPVEPVPPPPTPAKPKVQPPPVAVKPPPIIKDDAEAVAPPVKPKPPVPAKPKVKVDLHLADAPDAEPTKPVLKPKPRPKKVVRPPDESPDQASASRPEETGLSRDEVANKLGNKLKAAGVDRGVTSGPSGSRNGKSNRFDDFYAALHDQVMNKWTIPNQVDETAIEPVVRIHVEKNGRVDPNSVVLQTSSHNQVYDDLALSAARSIGYTLQPLPDGCPPDIYITFKLNR